MNDEKLIVVMRGGGDLATGVAQKLWRAGFRLAILEIPEPTTIRRTVALSTAMKAGVCQVEDMTARRADSPAGCAAIWAKGEIPVLADRDCGCLPELRPDILIDAIIAKRNLGTNRAMAPVTIALGPGFRAPDDVDGVIETMRGHYLGRLILRGEAIPDTATPGEIGGRGAERVVHAAAAGVIRHCRQIGDRVNEGDALFLIEDPEGRDHPRTAPSPLTGTLRGLIAEGIAVDRGMKCADVDPRPADEVDCHTISDKARCLGGAALEACLYLRR